MSGEVTRGKRADDLGIGATVGTTGLVRVTVLDAVPGLSDRDRAIAFIGNGQVRRAVCVEGRRATRAMGNLPAVTPALLGNAPAVAEKNCDGALVEVRRGKIRVPVPIEIRGHDRCGTCARAGRADLLEATRTVTQQDRDVISIDIGDCEIDLSVLVEIACYYRARISAGWKHSITRRSRRWSGKVARASPSRMVTLLSF